MTATKKKPEGKGARLISRGREGRDAILGHAPDGTPIVQPPVSLDAQAMDRIRRAVRTVKEQRSLAREDGRPELAG